MGLGMGDPSKQLCGVQTHPFKHRCRGYAEAKCGALVVAREGCAATITPSVEPI